MPKDIEWWLWVRSNYSMTSSTQAPKMLPLLCRAQLWAACSNQSV